MNDQSNKDAAPLTSWRPHGIRGLLAWVRENGARPMVLVAIVGKEVYTGGDAGSFLLREIPIIDEVTSEEGVTVSKVYSKTFPTILLNLSDEAIAAYQDSGDALRFKARFNGIAHDLYIPFDCIVRVLSPDEKRIDSVIPLTHEFVERSLDDRLSEQLQSARDQAKPDDAPPPPSRAPLRLVK